MDNLEKTAGLTPENVFKHFAKISDIPRCSGNERRAVQYIKDFAVENSLEAKTDEVGNLAVFKPATPGYENVPGVILQGHVDMIAAKDDEVVHDFMKDGIIFKVDEKNDVIKAEGTTLGADNGIAVAMMLAVLEDDSLKHPRIETLFTVDEESGMTGVQGLDVSMLTGSVLINIDSEEEGELLVGCAGGVRAVVGVPITGYDADAEKEVYRIKISGMTGGHSGAEIHKNRANAIVTLGNILDYLESNVRGEWNAISVSGGEKMNVIPRSSSAEIAFEPGVKSEFMKAFDQISKKLTETIAKREKNVSIQIEKVKTSAFEGRRVMSDENKKAVIYLLNSIPNGVLSMSKHSKELVESSNNIGVLSMCGNFVEINSAVRSSDGVVKTAIVENIRKMAEKAGAGLELEGDYPEWNYSEVSGIRDIMLETWKNMYGKEMKIKMIHAGLECGFLKEKLGEKIDMVSIGPDIRGAHTPHESLSISSTARVYDFLTATLENMNRYRTS